MEGGRRLHGLAWRHSPRRPRGKAVEPEPAGGQDGSPQDSSPRADKPSVVERNWILDAIVQGLPGDRTPIFAPASPQSRAGSRSSERSRGDLHTKMLTDILKMNEGIVKQMKQSLELNNIVCSRLELATNKIDDLVDAACKRLDSAHEMAASFHVQIGASSSLLSTAALKVANIENTFDSAKLDLEGAIGRVDVLGTKVDSARAEVINAANMIGNVGALVTSSTSSMEVTTDNACLRLESAARELGALRKEVGSGGFCLEAARERVDAITSMMAAADSTPKPPASSAGGASDGPAGPGNGAAGANAERLGALVASALSAAEISQRIETIGANVGTGFFELELAAKKLDDVGRKVDVAGFNLEAMRQRMGTIEAKVDAASSSLVKTSDKVDGVKLKVDATGAASKAASEKIDVLGHMLASALCSEFSC